MNVVYFVGQGFEGVRRQRSERSLRQECVHAVGTGFLDNMLQYARPEFIQK